MLGALILLASKCRTLLCNMRFRYIAAMTILCIALLAVLTSVTAFFDHNENMYLTAGTLLNQDKELYHDFAFLQMPLLPLLYGALFKVIDCTHYLLIGKITSILLFLFSGLLVFRYSRKCTNRIFFPIYITIIFLLNVTILRIAQECSNYILPMFCSLLAFYLFVSSINKRKVNPILIFLSGLLLSLAAVTKFYYLPTILPFIVTALLYPQSLTLKNRLGHLLLPLLLGILVGSIPALYYFAKSSDLFIFNNWEFHKFNAQWRSLTHFTTAMTFISKLSYTRRVFFYLDNLLLTAATVAIALSFLRTNNSKKRTPTSLPPDMFLSLLLFIVSLVTIFKATPMFIHYFAMPMSFLVLLFVSLYAHQQKSISTGLTRGVYIVVAVLIINGGIAALQRINVPWKPIEIHEIAGRIAIEVEQSRYPDAPIATLSPLYALEANLPIYPELATGPFLYRISDLLTPQQRARYTATSQSSLARLFASNPPAAIFVGFEKELDPAFVAYADSAGYHLVDGNFGDGKLYVCEASSDID